MAVFKCKMCGGTLEIEKNETVAFCEYCGTKQTLPKLDDDRKANLYDRANHFRRNNEFDKAMGIYEQILNEDSTDAESYWSLVLCRYGIEYVEDPATHKRIPTVNRAQYTSIFDDEDYKSALQYADGSQKEVYEAEANAINEIQKGILAISQKEEPFDVFICYKEPDQNGRRTPDSVLATELYHELTREGFKVFFSRITLEDKLGQEYEPYIFAALNSAKVMVVLGTKPEYFNAVWVKNEWNRYLALIKNGARKVLIPAFKDMDPYDLPEEFSHLQAQDMSKLGFMQDLIRGIKKLTQSEEPKEPSKETVVANTNTNIAPLLKRAFMFLEDGDFARADDFCEQVLNQDPENAEAYLGKLMAELKVHKQEDLADCEQLFDENKNYQKALRFADNKLAVALKGYITRINERNEIARLEKIYTHAVSTMKCTILKSNFEEAAQEFESIANYKDSSSLAKECRDKADANRLEVERKAEEKRIADEKAAKKRKKILVVATPIVCVIIALLIIAFSIVNTQNKKILLNSAKIDSIVEFGSYEQDNDRNNGKEPIEWIVLDKKGTELFLLSKYCLAQENYNNIGQDITWENCSLRKWLNEYFYNASFSIEEQSKIVNSYIQNPNNPTYYTNGGNDTYDKVFLLSIDEAKKYFSSEEELIAKTTNFVAMNLGDTFEMDICQELDSEEIYWLRSPGKDSKCAATIIRSGKRDYQHSINTCFGVRPAMWVDIS